MDIPACCLSSNNCPTSVTDSATAPVPIAPPIRLGAVPVALSTNLVNKPPLSKACGFTFSPAFFIDVIKIVPHDSSNAWGKAVKNAAPSSTSTGLPCLLKLSFCASLLPPINNGKLATAPPTAPLTPTPSKVPDTGNVAVPITAPVRATAVDGTVCNIVSPANRAASPMLSISLNFCNPALS